MQICLITPGQPSNNPRLVKEADALSEAGYAVHVICADCGMWPSLMDKDLMAKRSWTYSYAAGNPHHWSGIAQRARHKLARRFFHRLPSGTGLQLAAISPLAPALARSAMRFPADLYIAHHLVALPAAARAARKFDARLGYDVEDLYTGMRPASGMLSPLDELLEQLERRYLAACNYVTTAAPGFSSVYEAKYGISWPPAVLNVFPLSERPPRFRPSDAGQPLRLYWFSQCIGEKRGLEDVVRALGLLREYPIELHLRGNWQSGYQDRLRDFAVSTGADWKRITAHPPAPPQEMVRLAAEHDVGLALEQPVDENRNLCLTNKLFVYLLAGNAVAATAIRGQKLIVESLEEAAFCYEPGNADSLAHSLQTLCADRHFLDRARRRAWRWGSQQYNWDLEKGKFLNVVNKVMNRDYTPEAPYSGEAVGGRARTAYL